MNLGVYIQAPFCQTKCTYCNFRTGVFSSGLYEPYVEAVCREIQEVGRSRGQEVRKEGIDEVKTNAVADWLSDAVDTVYVGGGTPSLLAPAGLARMLAALREAFRCEWREVTLEADPETITREKAEAWRAAGFDRISLGAQSFNDAELKAAGRMHRRADTHAAARILRDAGFVSLSFDLIAGLPHQTAESWEASLEGLLRLAPEHISIYMMEIDEGSRLGREVISLGTRYGAPALPSDDQMAAFYERARERLAAAGYEHYEISNWALPGRRSQHNSKYWRRKPYLGLGAGAHSFDGRTRWANAHDPAAYVAAIQAGRLPREQRDDVTTQQALEEELFLGLRQLEGIDFARLERQYNVDLRERLAALRNDGLVEIEGQIVRLAPGRLTVSNEVFVELLG